MQHAASTRFECFAAEIAASVHPASSIVTIDSAWSRAVITPS